MSDLVVEKIVAAFADAHAGETACDTRAFKEKIRGFVNRGAPVEFVILAFPGKSINDASVSGHLPDLGEQLALQNLRGIIDAVGEVYAPGMILHVLSDGHFFMPAGVVRPPAELDAYVEALKAMKGTDRIIVHTIHDLYPEGGIEDKVAAFQRDFMPAPAEIHHATAQHRFYAWEYPGKIAFAFHEFCPVLHADLPKKGRQAMAKMIARAMIGCQIAVGRVAAARFGECVRLSIHAQHDPTSPKYYINLLPGVEGRGTPWFHVVEEEEASMRLVKRLASKSVGKPEVIAL